MMISSVHKEKQSSKATGLIENEKGSLVVKQNRRRKLPNFNYLLKGLTGTTGLALVVTLLQVVPPFNERESNMMTNYDAHCQQMVNKDAAVTQGQLQKLRGKEGVQKSVIHQILGIPYCVLPKTSIRSGVITEREVYKISENSRLMVIYEKDQYLGYGISESNGDRSQPKLKQIEIKKVWKIQAGEYIAGHRVIGGLGDISLEYEGSVLAPVPGVVDSEFVLVTDSDLIAGTKDCVIFSSPQLPAYLLKICGLTERYIGPVDENSPIGKTDGSLHLSLLSFRKDAKQTSNWIYVSPSSKLIEQLVR
ncbi:MAG: hypothetical protein AB4352_13690 [Hormoscilla sp.]